MANALSAGYSGAVVILDNQSHSGFHRITGSDPGLAGVPVVFLLKPEADRFRDMLDKEGGVIRVFIQGECFKLVQVIYFFFHFDKNYQ